MDHNQSYRMYSTLDHYHHQGEGWREGRGREGGREGERD